MLFWFIEIGLPENKYCHWKHSAYKCKQELFRLKYLSKKVYQWSKWHSLGLSSRSTSRDTSEIQELISFSFRSLVNLTIKNYFQYYHYEETYEKQNLPKITTLGIDVDIPISITFVLLIWTSVNQNWWNCQKLKTAFDPYISQYDTKYTFIL